MKKTMLRLMLVLTLILLLPLTAGAAPKIVDSGYGFYIGAGETILPDYPDLAYMIGEGLTKDDFNISYSSFYDIPLRNFDEHGRCTISPTFTTPSSTSFYMTYTPKVQGVGKETIFKGTIYVRKPLTEITVLTGDVLLATDETAAARFRRPDGTVNQYRIVDYDSSIIDAALENESWNDLYWSIHITPKAVGETDIVVEAYNGLQATFHVKVVEPPSKLSFAQETFTCYVGDTIDLGMDLGGGGMNAAPSVSLRQNTSYTSASYYFPNDWSHFYAKQTGEYTITMTTYNGHSATVYVNVYSKDNCVRLGLPYETVNVGQDYMYIYAYDANGNKITPRLAITKGQEIASIVNRQLVTTGEGTVEITATNPDGSTVSMTVEVVEIPTQVFLNATELTMNIGDTFDFEVTFDKGKTDYKLDHYHDDYFPPYKLFPIRREGNRIIAQAPGTARIEVFAGHLNVTCYITVLDSDAALSLVTPEEPFGVGHTFQLSVVDKAGNTYPATYSTDANNTNPAATVTPEGLLTGVWEGSTWIYATLEDGRVLHYFAHVEKVPTWISHPDITAHEHYTTTGLGTIETDVGAIYDTDVYISIEDESIATYDGMFFEFHKPGVTQVTLTAKNGGATTTFILTVLPADSTLYIFDGMDFYASGYYSAQIPMGYYMVLPLVVDYYGNIVPVTWEITYHVPGNGNPKDYSFVLQGDKLACEWPSGYCQVTGTAENGETIRMSATGYRLAKEIRFQKEEYILDVGESVQTEVMIVESNYQTGPISWFLAEEGIVSFTPESTQTGRPTVTGLRPGTTTLTAVLINGVEATCTITVRGERGEESANRPGDADESGDVDISDALAVLQYSVGWGVSINHANADVDDDGAVTISDALLILQYSVGWDVELK